MYTPNIIPTEDTTELGGINYIDSALLNCDGTCTLKYGYTTEYGEIISTSEYTGRITFYTIEIRDAVLYYTIKGFSSIVSVLNESIGTMDAQTDVKPTEVAVELIRKKLVELKLDSEYDVVDDGVVGTDQVTDIKEVTNATLSQYIKTVLECAVKEGEKSAEDEEDIGLNRTIYSFYLSDISGSAGKKSIVIYSYNAQDTKKDTKALETDVEFTWMGARDRFVTDFQVRFNGISLMCMDRGLTDKYTVDSSGALYVMKSLSASGTSGDNGKNDCQAEATVWSKNMIDISYKATMVTLGIPCEKPLGAIINVTPLLYGHAHITAGKYMIVKAVDRIDMNSFSTTIDLIKVVTGDKVMGYGTNAKGAKRHTGGLVEQTK